MMMRDDSQNIENGATKDNDIEMTDQRGAMLYNDGGAMLNTNGNHIGGIHVGQDNMDQLYPMEMQHKASCFRRPKVRVFLLVLAVVAILAVVLGIVLTRDNEGSKETAVSPSPSTSNAPLGVSTPCLTCSWVQLGSDLEGSNVAELFGEKVHLAKNGTRLAINAPQNSVAQDRAGLVVVYDFNSDGTWVKVGQELYGSAKNESIRGTLSRDGNRLAIAAPYSDGREGNENQIGRVQVYELQSGLWTTIGDPLYGEGREDRSGSSVSLSKNGSVIAIGAIGNNGTAGISSGHVRVYRDDAGSWVKIGDDIDGEAEGDYSGKSVSLSDDGEIVAIGAWRNDGNSTLNDTKISTGHVRVYELISGNWIQMGNDIDGDASHHEAHVTSLSSDGKTVAINGDWGEAAHVFRYEVGTQKWVEIGSGIDGDQSWRDEGGISLSANGERVAVSAPMHYSQDSSHLGITRVYDNINGTWRQVGRDIVGDKPGQNFGSISLSSDGSRIAVGGPAYSANSLRGMSPSVGVVRVFELRQN